MREANKKWWTTCCLLMHIHVFSAFRFCFLFLVLFVNVSVAKFLHTIFVNTLSWVLLLSSLVASIYNLNLCLDGIGNRRWRWRRSLDRNSFWHIWRRTLHIINTNVTIWQTITKRIINSSHNYFSIFFFFYSLNFNRVSDEIPMSEGCVWIVRDWFINTVKGQKYKNIVLRTIISDGTQRK